MYNLKEKKRTKDVDLKQIDNKVIDIDKPADKQYPIVEQTTNALLWPEEIKGGIDLIDNDNVTQVPADPDTPINDAENKYNK